MRALTLFVAIGWMLFCCGCGGNQAKSPDAAAQAAQPGQSAVSDDVSQKDVVKVAIASADHTTLVAAVKAAELVDALSNAGPFTVFAPTNEAFAKLPAGTVEDLLKPQNKSKLQDILQYHVYVGVINPDMVTGTITLNQVNGGNVTLQQKDGKLMANDANVLGSVKASNGIVYVVDKVLLPK
jgi:uncharacterized surface protein with fasciclin (FAS1) repeats